MPGSGDRNLLALFQSVSEEIYACLYFETANRILKSAGHSASRGHDKVAVGAMASSVSGP